MAITRLGANLNNFTTTRSPVLTLPAGIADKDVILAVVVGDTLITAPSYTGWVVVETWLVSGQGFCIILVRHADGSEGTSYTFTNILNTAASGISGAVVYRGCDPNVSMLDGPNSSNHYSNLADFNLFGTPRSLPEAGFGIVGLGAGFGPTLTNPTTATPNTGPSTFTEVLEGQNGTAGWAYVEESLDIAAGTYGGSTSGSTISNTLPRGTIRYMMLVPQVPGVMRSIPATSADDTTVGTVIWQNLNLVLDDPVQATGSTSSDLSAAGAVSHYLRCTNFNFAALPSDAIVTGVSFTAVTNPIASFRIIDNSVKLRKADATLGSTEKARSSSINWGVYYQPDVVSWGGPTDLWNESIDKTFVQDADFGVVVSATNPTGTGTADIHSLYANVFYLRAKTQTATARISNVATKTQAATARIAHSETKTQSAIARISENITKTQTATARVSYLADTKTQIATARIAKSVTKTQSAVARVTTTSTKTQTAIARIAITSIKTQTAVAKIVISGPVMVDNLTKRIKVSSYELYPGANVFPGTSTDPGETLTPRFIRYTRTA